MPNPTVIHPRSIKIEHKLKIIDTYIHFGCPEYCEIEPKFDEYEPDMYMRDRMGNYICVEVQLTPISTKKMQTKVNQFSQTHEKEHNANVMLLVSNNAYDKIEVPHNFKLVRIPVPNEPFNCKG